MPRYSEVNLVDYKLLSNTVPVRRSPVGIHYDKLENYNNIPPDIKLDWGGDLQYSEDSQDLEIAYTVEAYVQRLYHRLVTNAGSFPEDGSFGWNFDYLYSMTYEERRQLLPKIAMDVKAAVAKDPDTLTVLDVTAFLDKTDRQTHNINIDISLKPKSIDDTVVISLAVTPGA